MGEIHNNVTGETCFFLKTYFARLVPVRNEFLKQYIIRKSTCMFCLTSGIDGNLCVCALPLWNLFAGTTLKKNQTASKRSDCCQLRHIPGGFRLRMRQWWVMPHFSKKKKHKHIRSLKQRKAHIAIAPAKKQH